MSEGGWGEGCLCFLCLVLPGREGEPMLVGVSLEVCLEEENLEQREALLILGFFDGLFVCFCVKESLGGQIPSPEWPAM